jgi:Ca2+-binding RTX toxin-like protein
MNSADRIAIDFGAGDDTLDNSLGTIIGRISGGSGNDTFIGGAGSETFDSGSGIDNMAGRGGNDTYTVDNAADVVTEGSSGGFDTVLASVSYALAADSEIEVLQTTNAAVVGAINLTGNKFAQTITGNAGANVLNGGLGKDTLTGGLGNDNFVFDTKLSATLNVDLITDFSHANDTIVLENAIFTGIAAGTLSAAAFRVGTKALDASDRIIYNKSNGNVFYDADGNGARAQVLFAKLTGSPDDVTRTDFFII